MMLTHILIKKAVKDLHYSIRVLHSTSLLKNKNMQGNALSKPSTVGG